MKELLRTTDIVHLSFLTALLKDAGIEAVVLDNHMSILEGSGNAIPRRLVVSVDDFDEARQVLEDSGEQLDIR
ncbi:MAG: DUF2007 domain-containing protein [Alphaproteobacteria bacterium]|jgi:hypothetical protein|nr:DUF2007 domain-containing protein [Alphaproteobacteria bacterium]